MNVVEEMRNAPPMDGGAHSEVATAALTFGGVQFEVFAEPHVRWSLSDEHLRCVGASASGVHVRVTVDVDERLDGGIDRTVRCVWSGDHAEVSTLRLRAELTRVASGRYCAAAHVSRGAYGCDALLTALAGAIVEREGGVVLHSAGIELDGRVVLFVGPSGAGKTTAACHASGALAFSRDRTALLPTSSGWIAAIMPGGDEISLAPSAARTLPLAGILRVQRGESAVRIRDAASVGALTLLRESAQSTAATASDEAALFARLSRLASEVRIGTIYTVLGASITDVVRAWSAA